ncbi:hypothetical protein HHK36_025651 [Tetracentron sinense]|uniref:Uncharacterized protein n=1 Tax=Tetracentron sinense TaxID=13715 RepID=A0A835D5R8_TETSI|nr:hypothetical protein HHK36_025651 [Tetracentron sinense]
MCLGKEEGGYGFWDLHRFNLALLAKQGWRLATETQSLWSRLFKSIYYRDSNFMSAREGYRTSWAWKSLIAGRTALRGGLHWHWQVGNGRSINIWEDPWVPTLPNFRISSLKPLVNISSIVASLRQSGEGSWNMDRLRELFSDEEVEAIQKIPISQYDAPDQLV